MITIGRDYDQAHRMEPSITSDQDSFSLELGLQFVCLRKQDVLL